MSDVTKAVDAGVEASLRYEQNAIIHDEGRRVRQIVAAFLDAVKDAPTEEMLTAACNTPLPSDERESHLMGWQAMCLALRRGVAGDGK